MEKYIIRKATPNDHYLLQQIGRQTFFETFAADNSEKDMQKYLEESFATEKVQAELADPNTEFYLAQQDDQIIGYLKLNLGAAQTELQNTKALEIERIYVLKDFHGKNVGQLLYDQAIAVAKQVQSPYIWLGVWEQNPRAIRFYEKNGFVAFGTHIFHLGDDEQTDIMMKLVL